MPGKIIEDSAEVLAVIKKSNYCVLSLSDGDTPYAVPMSAAYDGECFYLHGRHKNSRKMEILQRNPKVSLTFVPQAEYALRHEISACGATMYFESVCVSGVAEILGENTEPSVRAKALKHIAEHYGIGHMAFDERVLAATSLIRVKASSIVGKRNPGK